MEENIKKPREFKWSEVNIQFNKDNETTQKLVNDINELMYGIDDLIGENENHCATLEQYAWFLSFTAISLLGYRNYAVMYNNKNSIFIIPTDEQ